MKKRILSLLLAALMIVGSFPLGALAAADPSLTDFFAGGDGTADAPYQIATKTQLENLATIVNGGNPCTDTYFVLTADITDPVTTVIGGNGLSFKGHFDGAGHTVVLAIDQPAANDVGLFGRLANGEIKNVTTAGVVSGGSSAVTIGSVCGANDRGTIVNCANKASVSGFNSAVDPFYVGGICGYNTGGTIMNCVNFGKVTGSNHEHHPGGVCGDNDRGTIAGCYYDNDICNKDGINGADVTDSATGLTTDK